VNDDLKADHTEELRNLCQRLEDTLSDATLIIDRQEDRIEELEATLKPFLCPSCRELLTLPSGDGCAAMTMHLP